MCYAILKPGKTISIQLFITRAKSYESHLFENISCAFRIECDRQSTNKLLYELYVSISFHKIHRDDKLFIHIHIHNSQIIERIINVTFHNSKIETLPI